MRPRIANAIERAAEPPPESQEETFARLAALSKVDYDRVREAEARLLGCRVITLDSEVARARAEVEMQNVATETGIDTDPEPAEEEVDGDALLTELKEVFEMFCVLPEHGAVTAALYVLFTYVCLAAARCAPLLVIVSPTKQCGKTRLMEILEKAARRGVFATNITAAVLFRLIERFHPTLLIDEYDSFVEQHPEIRNVINAGYRRSGRTWRCEGDANEPRGYATFGPKLLALIDKGKLEDTVQSRSIFIELQRKLPTQLVEELRDDKKTDEIFGAIRGDCMRWANDHVKELEDADPDVPDKLNDRTKDNWRPLLAIADAVGGEWPRFARSAARGLSTSDLEDESMQIQLLADIEKIFRNTGDNYAVKSKDLVDKLCKNEVRPWATYNKGAAISQRQVAKLLQLFKVAPAAYDFVDGRKRGYMHRQFKSAFKHYLPG